MPWFSTASFFLLDASTSLASTSGQRSLPFVVAPCPSVMESPRVTIDPTWGGAATSIPAMKYQCSIFFASGISDAET